MSQAVKCPECRIELELPAVLKPGKKYYCPDCDIRLPVGVKPPKSKSRPPKRPKRKKKPENLPFWKTKAGKVLSGLGFIVLGVAVLAYALLGDPNKPLKLIVGAICAILLGFGSLGYGFMADDSDSDSDDDTDSDSGGGDWGDD